MDQSSDQNLTPAEAAKRAKCGRSSIMRALDSKELKGIRDNRNRWKITTQDLDEWAKNRPDTNRSQPVTSQNKNPDTPQDSSEMHAELAVLKAKVENLAARLSDTQKERDRYAELLAQTSENLTKALEAQPRGFLARIFRR